MKTIQTLSIVGLCLLLCNCSKKGNTGNNTNPSNDFTISKMEYLNIPTDSSGQVTFEIVPAPAAVDDFKFSVSGLPANVTYDLSHKIHNGTLYSTLKLRSDYAEEKVYKVNITATNAAGTSKTEDLELNISKPANCHNRMLGTFKDAQGNGITFAKEHNNAFGVVMTNPDQEIKITMNCTAKTFTMYSQRMPGPYTSITTQGTGSFSPPDEITYNMTVTTVQFIPEDPSKTKTYTDKYSFSGKRVK